MRRAPLFALCLLAVAGGPLIAHAQGAPAKPLPASFSDTVAETKKAMMADPKAALDLARKAEALAQREPANVRETSLATALWLEAEALTRVSKVKEARAAAMRAIALADRDRRNDKLDGDLAMALARIADNDGDIATALKNYHKAHDIFAKLGEARSEAIAFQGLGSIYDEAHDFDHEIRYYRMAQQAYSEDPALDLSATNNIAFAYLQLGRFDEAEKGFKRALEISGPMKSPFLDANILSSLAAVYAKQHNFAEAEKAANRAMKLLGPRDESGGLPFVLGVKAMVDYERGSTGEAAADLDRAFRGVDLKTTIAPFRDMHEVAYKVYRDQGNLALAMAHLEAFKRLDDQGRSLAASANLALTGAQFDFTNQQLEIEHLKAVQLQRDISLKESRAALQRLLFAAFTLAGLLLIGWIAWRHMLVSRHRQALGEANVRLTQTLGERDVEIERRTKTEAQLRVAMDAAAQANRAKNHFIANMSHELRTPLNAIIGFSEIMSSGKTARAQEYAQDIKAGGRRLLAVLSDILDMARIDAGTVAIADDELPLSHIVDSVIGDFEEQARAEGKTISADKIDRSLWLRCDEGKMRQILSNLTSNALKFTGKDGRIDIRTEGAFDGVNISVSDNGVGIPADKIDHVLEPFGQAESAYARTHGGVGLGLPIVKALVDLHGGTLMIASKIGVGTTITVHLPRERIVETRDGGIPAVA